jgi:hypothetical protein
MTVPSASPVAVDAPERDRGGPAVPIPQYTKRQTFAVWAAATAPMAVLAWSGASKARSPGRSSGMPCGCGRRAIRRLAG